MNPFDLRGPQFLLFYALVSLFTIVIVGTLRRRRELEITSDVARLHDPYAIAYLRGGKTELIRVAVVSLVDRALLVVAGETVSTTSVGRTTQARKRIERDVLAYCTIPRDAADLFESSEFDTAAVEYELDLAERKLLPDDAMNVIRRPYFFAAAAVLLFFSITKIAVALSRGRTNVLFLIGLTVVAFVLVWKATFPRMTSRGRKYLDELHNVFESLKVRAATLRPGGADADLVLATAVFGTSVLRSSEFAWVKTLFPKAASSTSSCGSSCGSSGCGGGGCGGCGG